MWKVLSGEVVPRFQVSSLPGGLVLWHHGEQMLLWPPTAGEIMLSFRSSACSEHRLLHGKCIPVLRLRKASFKEAQIY